MKTVYVIALVAQLFADGILRTGKDVEIMEKILIEDEKINSLTGNFLEDLKLLVKLKKQKEDPVERLNLKVGMNRIPNLGIVYCRDEEDLEACKAYLRENFFRKPEEPQPQPKQEVAPKPKPAPAPEKESPKKRGAKLNFVKQLFFGAVGTVKSEYGAYSLIDEHGAPFGVVYGDKGRHGTYSFKAKYFDFQEATHLANTVRYNIRRQGLEDKVKIDIYRTSAYSSDDRFVVRVRCQKVW